MLWNMPTGEPPHKKKGSAPVYLPPKVVWKKYNYNYSHSLIFVALLLLWNMPTGKLPH